MKLILLICYVILGIVLNIYYKKIKLGKVGCFCWLNRRFFVCGVVKNFVDYLYGGGEGKISGGRFFVIL